MIRKEPQIIKVYEWRKENKEKVKLQNKRYYEKHRKRILAVEKFNRENNLT